jgi:hypothetical protein
MQSLLALYLRQRSGLGNIKATKLREVVMNKTHLRILRGTEELFKLTPDLSGLVAEVTIDKPYEHSSYQLCVWPDDSDDAYAIQTFALKTLTGWDMASPATGLLS